MDALPLTATGKIARRQLRALMQAGGLEEQSPAELRQDT
jgi:acyl-coenzyme A synthetase/AMP-(fatty) acid ligase